MPAKVLLRVATLACGRPAKDSLKFLDQNCSPIADPLSDKHFVPPDDEDDEYSLLSNNRSSHSGSDHSHGDRAAQITDNFDNDTDGSNLNPTTTNRSRDSDSDTNTPDDDAPGSTPESATKTGSDDVPRPMLELDTEAGSTAKDIPSDPSSVESQPTGELQNLFFGAPAGVSDPVKVTGVPVASVTSPGVPDDPSRGTGVQDYPILSTGVKQIPPSNDAFCPCLMRKITDYLELGDKQDPLLAVDPRGYNLHLRPTAPTSTLSIHDEGSVHVTVAHAINLFITSQTEPIVELMSVVLMQYNLKQGLKRFGDAARAVFQKEMMQIHNRKVLKPWQKKDFSPEELAMILT